MQCTDLPELRTTREMRPTYYAPGSRSSPLQQRNVKSYSIDGLFVSKEHL